MPDITLTFTNEINTSVQVGDTAYYSEVSTTAGFSTSSSIIEIGPISSINRSTKQIVCNPSTITSTTNLQMVALYCSVKIIELIWHHH